MNYKDKKSLVIYFSRADENYGVGYIDKGNTEVIAEYIRDIVGADLFKVERKKTYPKDYMSCIEDAREETNTNQRPELVRYLTDISKYEVIYIGSPIYWGGMPIPLIEQLERLDFFGKTIRIFTTHEGNGLSKVPEQVKDICRGANIVDDAIAIYGHDVKNARKTIEEWI